MQAPEQLERGVSESQALSKYDGSQAAADDLISQSKAGSLASPPTDTTQQGQTHNAFPVHQFCYPSAFQTQPHDRGTMKKDYQNNVIGIRIESIEPHPDPNDSIYCIRLQITFSAQRRRFASAFFSCSLITPKDTSETFPNPPRILHYSPVKQAFTPLSSQDSNVTWNRGWNLEPNVGVLDTSVQLGSLQGGRSGLASGEYSVIGTAPSSSACQWNIREGSHAKAGVGSHIDLAVYTNVATGFGIKCRLDGKLSSEDSLYLRESWMIEKVLPDAAGGAGAGERPKYMLTQVSQVKEEKGEKPKWLRALGFGRSRSRSPSGRQTDDNRDEV